MYSFIECVHSVHTAHGAHITPSMPALYRMLYTCLSSTKLFIHRPFLNRHGEQDEDRSKEKRKRKISTSQHGDVYCMIIAVYLYHGILVEKIVLYCFQTVMGWEKAIGGKKVKARAKDRKPDQEGQGDERERNV